MESIVTPSGRCIWYGTDKENCIVNLLVTEAPGRLAEPVALVPMKRWGKELNYIEEAMELAEEIAANPACLAKHWSSWKMNYERKPDDLRDQRGPDWDYSLRQPTYISGPFVGRYLSGGGILVYSVDGKSEPAPTIEEPALPIKHSRGRFTCPHCAGKFKMAMPLVTHLQRVHCDGMTANLMYSIWEQRKDARKVVRK